MRPIKTLYVMNKSHTDIGFTDYQDICFRQHEEFLDQALDLIEETREYPKEARYRWVCEATGPLMRYLAKASTDKLERFRYWSDEGSLEVTAMQYPHFTQLFTIEQMQRSLYPVRVLREEYGLQVDTAIQSDVTGVSWIFADLLPAIGIDFLTMSINEHRALAPQPRPGAFWWEGPSGRRMLVWNGYHYLFGRSVIRLGDWRFVDRFLPGAVARLEANPNYPFDFLFLESTRPRSPPVWHRSRSMSSRRESMPGPVPSRSSLEPRASRSTGFSKRRRSRIPNRSSSPFPSISVSRDFASTLGEWHALPTRIRFRVP